MAQFYFTKKAVNDLSEIWDYTVNTWSENQAEKYYSMIIDACHQLSENPEKGKDYFQIHTGLFGKKIAKHIVFFRVISESKIEITRILHEEMDVLRKLEK